MASQTTRLKELMARIGWHGEDVLPFMEWLRKTLPFVQPEAIRKLGEGYYFNQETGDVRKGYYRDLENFRDSVASLYMYKRQNRAQIALLHEHAMSVADAAAREPDHAQARTLYQKAFYFEDYVARHANNLPSSVAALCRNAAWLGFRGGLYAEAYATAMYAFEVGDVPPEIQTELNELATMCRREMRYEQRQRNAGDRDD